LKARIGFNDNAIRFDGTREDVFLNLELLRISTGLDVNEVAGTGCIDGPLNSSEARRQSATCAVCAIYMERSGLRVERRREKEPAKKPQTCDASKSLHRCPPPQKIIRSKLIYMKIRLALYQSVQRRVKKFFVLAGFDRIDDMKTKGERLPKRTRLCQLNFSDWIFGPEVVVLRRVIRRRRKAVGSGESCG